MKFSKKIAIFATVELFSLGGAAYTYNLYGTQDNSMILANIEALSQDDDGDDDGDGVNAFVWTIEHNPCKYTVWGKPGKKANVYIKENNTNQPVTFTIEGKATVSMSNYTNECYGGGSNSCINPKLCPKSITTVVTLKD